MEASLPRGVNVFDLFFDVSNNCWQSWKSVFNYVKEDRATERNKKVLLSIHVPTQDYLRLEYILDRHLEIKKPICLLGPTAQGKSQLLRQYVYEKDIPLKLRRYDLIGFSIYIDGKKMQHIMEQHLVKETKTLCKPPDEKHQVFFIDDIHMA